MTNEEALRILHCPDTVGGLYSEKYGEALNMAMGALEQLKEIKGIIKDKRYIQEDVLKYKMICEVIEK